MAPTHLKKQLQSSTRYKQQIKELNQWEEDRRRAVANDREMRVQSLISRMQQRDKQVQEQARELAAAKKQVAQLREGGARSATRSMRRPGIASAPSRS